MTIFTSRKSKLAVGTVAAVVLAGGGGALAATELGSPSATDSAIISDAAGQLGVQPSALSSALTKAIDDEINSEVSAGQITQAQANALEAQINSGQVPLFSGLVNGFGVRGFRGGVFSGDLSAAATYLGLAPSQIRTDIQSGQTLAQIANATSGKSSSGLVAALLSAEESKLASAVSAGKLSSSQEQSIESNLQAEITNLVNGTRPAGGFGGGFGFHRGRPGFGGRGFWIPGGSDTTPTSTTPA